MKLHGTERPVTWDAWATLTVKDEARLEVSLTAKK